MNPKLSGEEGKFDFVNTVNTASIEMCVLVNKCVVVKIYAVEWCTCWLVTLSNTVYPVPG